ncbi:MAG: fumarate hydratase [Spirochaetota bacterium]
MKTVSYDEIVKQVASMCIEANIVLPDETKRYYTESKRIETGRKAGSVFSYYMENMKAEEAERIPVCQDTGIAVFFVRIGTDVEIEGASMIHDAINEGVRRGYTEGYLRKSVVSDPLFARINTNDNTPAIIHMEYVKGDTLEISFAPKGGGAENMSRLFMLTPSAGRAGVVNAVMETVQDSCANPCPPVVVGIGIGGNFEYAPYLAKKALFRGGPSQDNRYAELEKEILERLNGTGIGPQGFGGDITAFDVRIEHAPCHIASLPVAVNLNCHVHRHMSISF